MDVKFQNRILKRVQNDTLVMPNLFRISFVIRI
jgi:hypothetical protein